MDWSFWGVFGVFFTKNVVLPAFKRWFSGSYMEILLFLFFFWGWGGDVYLVLAFERSPHWTARLVPSNARGFKRRGPPVEDESGE